MLPDDTTTPPTATTDIPYGYCHCGCGQLTTIARRNATKRGDVKGEPHMYRKGHFKQHPSKTKPTYVVDEATGCWVWQRLFKGETYGRIGRGGKMWCVHRWYYTQAKGPIPEGMDLDHLCRNRACVNPDHLEPVTQAENVRRGNSAKLTADDVREIRRLVSEGHMTQRAIAHQFGVSFSRVCMIAKRVVWRDVE